MIFIFISQKPSTHTALKYVPVDAERVLYINSHELMIEAVRNIAFTSQDQHLLDKILSHIKEEGDATATYTDFGINLNEGIAMFEGGSIHERYYGVIFSIHTPSSFIEEMKNILTTTQVGVCNDKVGIILSSKNAVIIPNLIYIADSLKNNPNIEIFKSLSADDFNKHISILNRNSKLFNRLDLTFNDGEILIEGNISESSKQMSHSCLKPEGMHLTTSSPSFDMLDSMSVFKQKNIDDIIAFSANHYGMKIIDPTANRFLPLADMILTFKKEINVDEFLMSMDSSFTKSQNSDEYYLFHENKLYTQQVSPNEIYIGIHPFKTENLVINNGNLFITGDVCNITSIEASSLIEKFISIIPMYRSSDNLAKSVHTFTIESKENRLKGNITFADGKYAINEVIRWALDSEFMD